jgi:N-methylhydantoinase B
MATEQPRRLDENLVVDAGGGVRCGHCDRLASAAGEPFLSRAVEVRRDPGAAGPQVRDSGERFVDARMVFRQRCCAGCGVALLTEVVPADDPRLRTKEL